MFEIIGTVFPVLVIFLLLRGILQTILRSGRRRQEQENGDEYEDYEEDGEEEQEEQTAVKKPDLAAEFERRLKKTSEAAQGEAKDTKQEVLQAGKAPLANKQRVHRDNETLHDAKGRIHREGEKFAHDKGKVYYDPKGDYSYNEARFNAQAAAFRANRAALSKGETKRPRLKLKHSALAQGFVWSQVLDKPRSLKPYGAEDQL